MSVLFLELSGFSTATWPDVTLVSRTCHVSAGAGLSAWTPSSVAPPDAGEAAQRAGEGGQGIRASARYSTNRLDHFDCHGMGGYVPRSTSPQPNVVGAWYTIRIHTCLTQPSIASGCGHMASHEILCRRLVAPWYQKITGCTLKNVASEGVEPCA